MSQLVSFGVLKRVVDNFPDLEAVIFDLDGTLIDTMNVHRDGYMKIFSRKGWKFDDQLWNKDGPKGGTSWLAKMLVKNGVGDPESMAVKVKGEKTEWFLRNLDLVKIVNPVYSLLMWLKKSGKYKLICATTAVPEVAYGILENKNIARMFDLILTANDVPKDRLKPDPFIYQLVVNKLALSPLKSLVLEDSSVGIKASLSAGISCYNVIEQKFYKA